jgi:sugar lactone lactonase YvrE
MLQLRQLGDCDSNGLTSCAADNCLYVSDSLKNRVFKVELQDDNVVFNWAVGLGPEGLSVNSVRNLLVACHKANAIEEYTANGELFRRIALEVDDIKMFPYHAVQLTNGQYVVCYSDGNLMRPAYGVSEVDEQGRIVFCYTEELGECKFSWPNRLTVDESNTHLLVADTNNHRILVIDRRLHRVRELIVSHDSELCQPSCLFFDESLDRLYISEFDDITRRIFVFDNVMSAS